MVRSNRWPVCGHLLLNLFYQFVCASSNETLINLNTQTTNYLHNQQLDHHFDHPSTHRLIEKSKFSYQFNQSTYLICIKRKPLKRTKRTTASTRDELTGSNQMMSNELIVINTEIDAISSDNLSIDSTHRSALFNDENHSTNNASAIVDDLYVVIKEHSNDYFGDEFRKFRKFFLPLHGYLSLSVCLFGIIANILNIIVLTR